MVMSVGKFDEHNKVCIVSQALRDYMILVGVLVHECDQASSSNSHKEIAAACIVAINCPGRLSLTGGRLDCQLQAASIQNKG